MAENELAYVHSKKAVLLRDRQYWLEIIEMLHSLWKETKSSEYKEMMKFCGEQSQWCKNELIKIK